MSALTRRTTILWSSLITGAMLSRSPAAVGAPSSALLLPLPSPAKRPLQLVLLGDVMLGRIVDDSLAFDAARKSQAFGDVLPLIKGLGPCTIVAGNLECAVTSHDVPTPKAFNFKIGPERADGLREQLHLDFVSLANNHVLDYGQPGLASTHEVLDRLGVAHAGSGLQPAAAAAAVVERCGWRVAFLSYADHYQEWAATSSRPGINFVDPASFDAERLRREVAAARASPADLVVVAVHWGPNWAWEPDVHIQALGRAWLEAGADLVFGHSAHHIQGVQVIARKAIIYGAGPFIDDYAVDPQFRNDLGCLWLASFGSGDAGAAGGGGAGGSEGLQLQRLVAVPLHIQQIWRRGEKIGEPGEGLPPYLPQVDLARGQQRRWVKDKLTDLCGAFGTSVADLPDGLGLQLTGGELSMIS